MIGITGSVLWDHWEKTERRKKDGGITQPQCRTTARERGGYYILAVLSKAEIARVVVELNRRRTAVFTY
jgi:hypothetical protein